MLYPSKTSMTENNMADVLEEFSQRFENEENCLRFLASLKWKNGFVCPSCGHTNFCKGKSPLSRRCTRCKKEISPTAQTLFHRCKIPLTTAFKIVFLTCKFPDISSSVISVELNKRQMTCYHLQKKVKKCLSQNRNDRLLKELSHRKHQMKR